MLLTFLLLLDYLPPSNRPIPKIPTITRIVPRALNQPEMPQPEQRPSRGRVPDPKSLTNIALRDARARASQVDQDGVRARPRIRLDRIILRSAQSRHLHRPQPCVHPSTSKCFAQAANVAQMIHLFRLVNSFRLSVVENTIATRRRARGRHPIRRSVGGARARNQRQRVERRDRRIRRPELPR